MAHTNPSPAGEHIVGPHESADDHGADHGHDDHAHGAGESLGPIDVTAWGAALFGIVLGVIVLIALVESLS
jgi:hypothetical protein